MQAFFLTNGYTSNFKKEFGPFLWSSFKSLIIPYVSFALIGKGFDALLWRDSRLWVRTVGIGDQTWFFIEESYWFLSALFMARILYWLLYRCLRNEYCLGVAVILMMLVGFFLNHIYDGVSLDAAHFNNHLHYRNALCMMIFIWIGEFLKNHKDNLERYIGTISIAYLIVVIGTSLVGKGCVVSYTHSADIPYRRIPFYLFYATSGSVLMLWLSKKILANKVLEYLGKGSLVVYVIHFVYLRLLTSILPSILNPYSPATGLLFYIVTFILTAILSAATIWVFNHKYIKILIGKF